MAKVGVILLMLMLPLAAKEKVIFGEDNRLDVYEVSNSLFKKLAESTAGMVAKKDIVLQGSSVFLKSKTLQENGMCASERFANQPTPVYCSGFLVAPNILATAGHCMVTQKDCDDYAWIFGYKINAKDQAPKVLENNIYNCKKVLVQALDEESGVDHALIELDRSVIDRSPLQVKKAGTASVDDELVIIGHPSGLPLKVADGAKVRSLEENFFVANLDAYGGNSGAPVFNAKTGVVEGILARGEDDYQTTPQKCRISIRLPNDSEGGEDVTYITNIKELRNYDF